MNMSTGSSGSITTSGSRRSRVRVAWTLPAVSLLLVAVPGLLAPDVPDAATMFRAWSDRVPYEGLALQLAGAVCVVPAVLAAVDLTRARRGRVLAGTAAVVGCLGAVSTVLVLGIEVAQGELVSTMAAQQAAVTAALAVNDSVLFLGLLLLGFLTCTLAVVLVLLALWRAGFLGWAVLPALVVAIALTAVPLPAAVAAVLPGLGLALVCAGAGLALRRDPGVVGDERTGTRTAETVG